MAGNTQKRDDLISGGVEQFMKTLDRTVSTKAIVITVQPDGYTQVHSTVDEPEMTRQLMRVAVGDHKGATFQ